MWYWSNTYICYFNFIGIGNQVWEMGSLASHTFGLGIFRHTFWNRGMTVVGCLICSPYSIDLLTHFFFSETRMGVQLHSKNQLVATSHFSCWLLHWQSETIIKMKKYKICIKLAKYEFKYNNQRVIHNK